MPKKEIYSPGKGSKEKPIHIDPHMMPEADAPILIQRDMYRMLYYLAFDTLLPLDFEPKSLRDILDILLGESMNWENLKKMCPDVVDTWRIQKSQERIQMCTQIMQEGLKRNREGSKFGPMPDHTNRLAGLPTTPAPPPKIVTVTACLTKKIGVGMYSCVLEPPPGEIIKAGDQVQIAWIDSNGIIPQKRDSKGRFIKEKK